MKFLKLQICETQNASVIAPTPILKYEQKFSIFDSRNDIVSHSDINSLRFKSVPPESPESAKRSISTNIEGPTLFAGFASESFGHVITAGIGRLWALESLPKSTTLLFIARRPPQRIRYLASVLDALGIKNKFRIENNGANVEELYTASDLYGERYAGLASPEYIEWMKSRFPREKNIKSGEKLYISRSGLGPKAGRYACEDHLEDLLVKDGFEVFRPEIYSLEEQIDRYRKAEILVFAEGSAMHVFALVKDPRQTVVIIKRRTRMMPLIKNQTIAFDKTPVRFVEAINQVHWRPRGGDAIAVSVLDFDQLRTELIVAKALSDSAEWVIPTLDMESASISEGLRDGHRLLTLPELQKLRRARRHQQRLAKRRTT